MFRIVATLARGAAAQACEDLADRHALPLLDQQIREAAGFGRRTRPDRDGVMARLRARAAGSAA